MAIYITRVELRDLPDSREDSEDIYEELHDAMESEGFSRTIKKGAANRKMPRATYVYTKDDVRYAEDVNNKAEKAARKTGRKFGTLTIKAARIDDVDFYNLNPA